MRCAQSFKSSAAPLCIRRRRLQMAEIDAGSITTRDDVDAAFAQ
jgi:hypothetical protein